MIRSLYSAAAGLLSANVQEGVLADNLANAQTPGYRARAAELGTFATLAVRRVTPFSTLLGQTAVGSAPLAALAGGAVVNQTAVNWSQGTLTASGNPLAVAIDGPGFFAVSTPAGLRYTRGGDFRLSAGGVLTNPAGDPVLNAAGRPITVPGGDSTGTATIGPGGAVDIGGKTAGTVGVFAAPLPALAPAGGGLFALAAGTAAPGPQAGAVLRPGYVEGSNVDVIGQMAALLAVQQAFASDANAVQTAGTALQTAITDVGTVA